MVTRKGACIAQEGIKYISISPMNFKVFIIALFSLQFFFCSDDTASNSYSFPSPRVIQLGI